MRATSMERIEQSSSQLSDLADCPVCNRNLEEVGDATAQEVHVRTCLEGGSGPTSQAPKYLVYRLPAESTLIGLECVICLEEFAKGSMVARLSACAASITLARVDPDDITIVFLVRLDYQLTFAAVVLVVLEP
ncbi:hypothetical protein C8R44DRAFT_893563 [Mycena epipterygia]|nr:hypothetical protein C8R44DRAFT_893563 [Mycena epipterygia]